MAIKRIDDKVTCDAVMGEVWLLKCFKRELKSFRARTTMFDSKQLAGAVNARAEINQLLDGIRFELDYRDKLIAKYDARGEGPEAGDVYSPSNPMAA